ncbi:TPA: ribbon-helix-helix domain-containing protein, partial [Clostridioides difficile]|nr:ribbon-helix-helix domain-containing protein [Clostridioides difficile]
ELKHEQTTLRIPEDLYKALIDLSKEIGMPIASIVIIACWLYISKIN